MNIPEIRQKYCGNPKGFEDWISFIKRKRQPHVFLSGFSLNYYYFSIQQLPIFARIFHIIDPYDTETLCEISKVLYEELGRGDKNKIHSKMILRFAKFCGVTDAELSQPNKGAVPGVTRYLDTLTSLFRGRDLSRAIAGYLFLEETAVSCYQPIVDVFESKNYEPGVYEFFKEHSVVEIEHMELAEALVERSRVSFEANEQFIRDLETLKAAWADMWRDLYEITLDSEELSCQ